jgi:hypothetical protein
MVERFYERKKSVRVIIAADGVLYVLEPESDDGDSLWNSFAIRPFTSLVLPPEEKNLISGYFRIGKDCAGWSHCFSSPAAVSEIKRILEKNLTRSGITNSRRYTGAN